VDSFKLTRPEGMACAAAYAREWPCGHSRRHAVASGLRRDGSSTFNGLRQARLFYTLLRAGTIFESILATVDLGTSESSCGMMVRALLWQSFVASQH
jgi:hypothetical protein